ncbi:TadE/TadG family type IV pilus assembly protein [Methylobacterium sp. P31]
MFATFFGVADCFHGFFTRHRVAVSKHGDNLERKRVWGFARHKSGATAVEFALIGPVLVALLMASVEFGLIFYTYTTAEFVTNDVARQLSSNRITTAEAQSAIPPRLPRWAQAAVVVSATASSTDPTTNVFTVTTTLPLMNAAPSHFFSAIYNSKTMRVISSMQQEPTS